MSRRSLHLNNVSPGLIHSGHTCLDTVAVAPGNFWLVAGLRPTIGAAPAAQRPEPAVQREARCLRACSALRTYRVVFAGRARGSRRSAMGDRNRNSA